MTYVDKKEKNKWKKEKNKLREVGTIKKYTIGNEGDKCLKCGSILSKVSIQGDIMLACKKCFKGNEK